MIFSRICQIASLLSLILSASMAGGSFWAYKYFSSEQFKNRVMNEVMERVNKILPAQIDKKIPGVTGKSVPIKKKLSFIN